MNMESRKSLGAACLAVIAALGTPGGAAAQEPIATTERATPVSAYGGWLAWSEYDAATERFRLMRRAGGQTAAVPVASRGVPFDVDLGPGPRGDVSAVYSRCRVEPDAGDPRVRQWAAGTPQWSSGRGCDLHRFSFATGRETRIAAASTPGASEVLPTIWKDRLAFARVYTSRRGPRGKRAYLYHRPVLGAGRSRRLPAPPRARNRRIEPGPSGMDLAGRRLAVAWETYREGPVSEIDLIAVGRGRRIVERVGSGEIQTVNLLSPAIRDGHVHYGQGSFGDSTEGSLLRYRIRTRRYQEASVTPDRTLLATAAGADGIYTLVSGGVQAGCSTSTETDGGVTLTGPCRLDLLRSIDWRRHTPRRFPLP